MIRSQALENDIVDVKMKKRVKNMQELKNELKAAGKTVLKGGRKEAVHNMAREAGIAIEVTEVDIEEGWEGMAKGSLQILWERGFLDSNVANVESHCTTNGQLDGAGDPINCVTLSMSLPCFSTLERQLASLWIERPKRVVKWPARVWNVLGRAGR